MDRRGIAVLRIVDGLWETYEWVPVFEISERLGVKLPLEKTLKRFERDGLLELKTVLGEPSVRLTERGLDTLAVWDFIRHGVIDEIGHIVGEGKEAVVVLARKGDEDRAVKFHRFSSAEFRRIKESLAYSALRWWRKRLGRGNRPLHIPRAKAQIEYTVLRKLHGKVNVPEPFGINRHAIVMEFIGDGVPAPLLSKVRVEGWMREEVREQYGRALEQGVVHGDLSKYNIMVRERCYLIDWPQAVPADWEGAEELKKRDLERIEAI